MAPLIILFALALAGAASPLAQAQTDKHRFDIPAQPLGAALQTLADQAGVQMFYAEDSAAGKATPALRGEYTTREAVNKLLAGTGLTATLTEDGTVTVAEAEPEPETEPEVVVLPPITVTGQPWDDTSYNVQDATTATKTDTPIMETPVNIQVVPQQVLKDQQAVRLGRAVENVSGVYRGSGGGDIADDTFVVRGFETFQTYRDGVRFDPATNFGGPRETANLERVEVLKGPASILYGRADPGGIINLVTKKPLLTRYYSLEQQFGSFDYYRTAADATGPISEDQSLLYRLNLAYETRGSFRDFSEGERVFVAPVLHWAISPRTEANLELEYIHNSVPFTYGFPVIGDRPARLSRDTNLGGPQGTNIVADDVLFGFNWSHAFNDGWTLRHRFNTQFVTADSGITVNPDSLEANNRTLNRSIFNFKDSETELYYTTLDLIGKFKTGPLEHELLVGGDYYNFSDFFNFRVGAFTPLNDIFNPVHVPAPIVFDPLTFPADNTTKWYGLYLQDQLRLPYDFHVLGGFRYDNATSHDNLADIETNSNDAVTPRVGLLWRPIPQASLYASYLENFGAVNFGQTFSGNPLPPQTAQQWEVGVKTEFLDGKMTGTVAYYDLTKQNVATSDPNDPTGLFSIPVGEVNHRGIEVDVSGEPLPGWNLIGSYSYIDSEITRANDLTQGNRFSNVPRHGGSVWSTYTLQKGGLRGLKLGAGVVARSQREGNDANDFQLPGYARVDLMAGYELKLGKSKASLQLNVENLTDKYYFGSSGGDRLRVNVGAPRTFLGSIRVEF